jgi:hypothetical protein
VKELFDSSGLLTTLVGTVTAAGDRHASNGSRRVRGDSSRADRELL